MSQLCMHRLANRTIGTNQVNRQTDKHSKHWNFIVTASTSSSSSWDSSTLHIFPPHQIPLMSSQFLNRSLLREVSALRSSPSKETISYVSNQVTKAPISASYTRITPTLPAISRSFASNSAPRPSSLAVSQNARFQSSPPSRRAASRLAQAIMPRPGSSTENYVAYGMTQKLCEACSTQADYSIPQVAQKGVQVPKTEGGEDLGVGTGWWYEGELTPSTPEPSCERTRAGKRRRRRRT